MTSNLPFLVAIVLMIPTALVHAQPASSAAPGNGAGAEADGLKLGPLATAPASFGTDTFELQPMWRPLMLREMPAGLPAPSAAPSPDAMRVQRMPATAEDGNVELQPFTAPRGNPVVRYLSRMQDAPGRVEELAGPGDLSMINRPIPGLGQIFARLEPNLTPQKRRQLFEDPQNEYFRDNAGAQRLIPYSQAAISPVYAVRTSLTPHDNAPWYAHSFTWLAPAFYHWPLYFEQVNVERYGNSVGRLQPLLSGAHFFGSAALLPYKMGNHRMKEPMYVLGTYSPGNWNPCQLHWPGYSPRGVLYQSLAVTGLVFVLP